MAPSLRGQVSLTYIIRLINEPDLANRGSIGLSEPGTDGDSPYPFI